MKNLKEFSSEWFRLDNKTAIITGGASGLGQYYTQALMKSGADVLVVSHSENGWQQTADLVKKNGRKIEFLKEDITKAGAAEKIVATAEEKFGHIDILINNAGLQRRGSWKEFKDTDWQAVIELNLNAGYYLSHAVARIMAEQKSGKIINIASMQSYRAGKFIFPYTASKHAIVGLTKAYADALATDNVQVNALAPGYIDTPMTQALRDDQARNTEILAHIPANHWADPSELMGAIVFLSSAASDYITGVTLPVDGGYLLR
ncbi:SDR family NAD(P)-dependent oxidoreductase [Oenococcus sicerae]|uniref:SDR family NAD(P)-dependent oxidoreductase n=1 Tax=Oenococcus sicerae TaxID=2203724 RepID=UPI0010B5524D|nr:2-dehydro-3-deoxy-D-gluconate 5-dehydrogenase {ECO:0000303/PubMed:24509771} [Oenococcus sicerae]